MKIATTYDNGNGEIFQHFGRSQFLKVYDIEDGKVASTQVIDTTASGGHEAIAYVLRDNGVTTLICGGIGGGAINALNSLGIRILPGISGSSDEAVKAYLAGTIQQNDPAYVAAHHEHDGGCCHDEH
jgi:predicted Fe-Mo cluster-binding NifX family protein